MPKTLNWGKVAKVIAVTPTEELHCEECGHPISEHGGDDGCEYLDVDSTPCKCRAVSASRNLRQSEIWTPDSKVEGR